MRSSRNQHRRLALGSQERLSALGSLTSTVCTWHLSDGSAPALRRVGGSLPRAHVAAHVRPTTAPQAPTAGLDACETALTEGLPRLPQRASLGIATTTAGRPHRVVARAAGPGSPVLTGICHPAWRATVNGRAAEVLPASYAFRGVVMAAGRSEVSFSYEPASYRIGLFLGLASLAVVLAVAAAAFPLRRP